MPELERLIGGHLDAVLVFERENRAYFARSLTDRGDDFYDALAEHHRALLDEQDSGTSAFFVLVDWDGSILGRFNLYDLDDATARVGYRVAQRATGRGLATAALVELCRRAARDCGARTLTAEVSDANHASRRVLDKAGFTPAGACVVAGQPGKLFTMDVTRMAREWTLRRAGEDDARWLTDLKAVTMRSDLERLGLWDESWARRRFLETYVPANTWIVVWDGEDVGSIAVRQEPDSQWIEHFYLDPMVQGRGIGGQVLADALRRCGDHRPFRLAIDRGSRVQRLYERLGFRHILDDANGVDQIFERSAGDEPR